MLRMDKCLIRHTISLVLILVLFISFFPPLNATGETGAIVTVENAIGNKGRSIQVKVTVENVKGLIGGGFSINYDPTIAKPVNYEAGNLIEGMSLRTPEPEDFNPDNYDGTVRITWVHFGASSPTQLNSGTLAVITFDLLKQGESDLELEDVSIGVIIDGTETNVGVNKEDGSITIFDVLYGDVIGNGFVGVGDAILMLRHIIGLTEFTPKQFLSADVNYDGTIDINDVMLVLQHVVGLNHLLI